MGGSEMVAAQARLDVDCPPVSRCRQRFGRKVAALLRQGAMAKNPEAAAQEAAGLFRLAFLQRPKRARLSDDRKRGREACRSLGRRLAVAALVPDSQWHQGLLGSWKAPDLVEVRQVAAVLVELYQPLFGGCNLAVLIGLKEEE